MKNKSAFFILIIVQSYILFALNARRCQKANVNELISLTQSGDTDIIPLQRAVGLKRPNSLTVLFRSFCQLSMKRYHSGHHPQILKTGFLVEYPKFHYFYWGSRCSVKPSKREVSVGGQLICTVASVRDALFVSAFYVLPVEDVWCLTIKLFN